MGYLWLNGGKIVEGSDGKLIECDRCPCVKSGVAMVYMDYMAWCRDEDKPDVLETGYLGWGDFSEAYYPCVAPAVIEDGKICLQTWMGGVLVPYARHYPDYGLYDPEEYKDYECEEWDYGTPKHVAYRLHMASRLYDYGDTLDKAKFKLLICEQKTDKDIKDWTEEQILEAASVYGEVFSYIRSACDYSLDWYSNVQDALYDYWAPYGEETYHPRFNGAKTVEKTESAAVAVPSRNEHGGIDYHTYYVYTIEAPDVMLTVDCSIPPTETGCDFDTSAVIGPFISAMQAAASHAWDFEHYLADSVTVPITGAYEQQEMMTGIWGDNFSVWVHGRTYEGQEAIGFCVCRVLLTADGTDAPSWTQGYMLNGREKMICSRLKTCGTLPSEQFYDYRYGITLAYGEAYEWLPASAQEIGYIDYILQFADDADENGPCRIKGGQCERFDNSFMADGAGVYRVQEWNGGNSFKVLAYIGEPPFHAGN